MKTKFTPNEIMSNRGCYERSDVNKLSFIGNSEIDINDILDSEIPMIILFFEGYVFSMILCLIFIEVVFKTKVTIYSWIPVINTLLMIKLLFKIIVKLFR